MTSERAAIGRKDQVGVQGDYHRALFPALHDWEHTESAIVAFTEDDAPSGLLGLDQMGHFGPHGCDLVVDVICAAFPEGNLRLCELGSGFGGALRYIADELADEGVVVDRMYGVDIVPEHAKVSRDISEGQKRANVTEICASAEKIPLPDASLDVVFVTGSMPHFPEPGKVLAEAARVLKPQALLVFTEEVSLTAESADVGEDFRELHPEGVFFTTPHSRRIQQMKQAGFVGVEQRALKEWAIALLGERMKVMRIFRGTVSTIYGEESVDRIHRTLDVTRDEYAEGRIIPMLLSARRI